MSVKISLEEALRCGREANEYARKVIKKGNTWIDNEGWFEVDSDSNVSQRQPEDIGDAVAKLRDQYNRFLPTLANMDDEQRPFANYEFRVRSSLKHAVGNCYELALQSLDNVLCNESLQIRGEVFKIRGGDHYFLVLNRALGSDYRKPETWGPGAVIVDALSPPKGNVYPASDYMNQLENFKITPSDANATEPFDPKKHTLQLESNFSTDLLRKPHMPDNSGYPMGLKVDFTAKSERIIKALECHIDELDKKKDGMDDCDEEYLDLEDKIKERAKCLTEIRGRVSSILQLDGYEKKYREFQEICDGTIKEFQGTVAKLGLDLNSVQLPKSNPAQSFRQVIQEKRAERDNDSEEDWVLVNEQEPPSP